MSEVIKPPKILSVVLIVFTTLTASVIRDSITSTRPDSQTGPARTADLLHLNRTRIQNALDQNVTLIGVGYGDYTQLFNSGNATADAVNIRSHGYNVVELVIEWGGLMTGLSSFNITYESIIKTRVGALTQQGLYIIVTLHADCDWTVQDCLHLESILGPTQYCSTGPVYYSQAFYTTSISNSTSGVAQLADAWLTISGLFPNNGNVIGYDILNEPFYCGMLPNGTIRSDWHIRADELVSVLRRNGDTRMIFLQEAPENLYFGNPCCGVWYTNMDINFTNYVATAHFYEGENNGSPWQACTGNYSDIYSLWNNVNYPGTCAHTTAVWAGAAQTKFPNQAFFVSEYGSIWGNSPGDINQSWSINATRAFYTTGVAGWTYWSHDTAGTWTRDIKPVVTMKPTSLSIGLGGSTSGSFPVTDNQSFIGTLTYSYSSSVVGLTATFSPGSSSLNIAGSTNLQYIITVGSSVRPGEYTISWRAIFGSLSFTSSMMITVQSQTITGTVFPVDKLRLLFQFFLIAASALFVVTLGIVASRSRRKNMKGRTTNQFGANC